MSDRLARLARRLVQALADDRGQYLTYTLLSLPLILTLMGLVIDGGYMYRHYRIAQIAVDTAAQAAAHEVDADYFAHTNQVRLSPAAPSVAWEYATSNSRGRVVVRQVVAQGDQVVVHADAHLPTIFMRTVGIPQVVVRITGSARPAYGIDVEGQ